MANMQDIKIKTRKGKTCVLIDVAISADRKVMQKEAENKLNARVFMYGDTRNVEHEMFGHVSSNERFKEEIGNHNRKTFSRFNKNKHNYTWDITSNTESTAV
jgi:activator of HSP90 ATPase